MNRLSTAALVTAALAGSLMCASGASSQESAAGPIETPRCSFACVLTSGAPRDVAPEAVAADTPPSEASKPTQKSVASRSHVVLPTVRRTATAASYVRRARVATRIASARAPAAKTLDVRVPVGAPVTVDPPVKVEMPVAVDTPVAVVAPMPHPSQVAAVVALQPQAVASPVVQVESEHRTDAAPRRVVEAGAADLYLDAGAAAGDVETSGFKRYAPSWSWLITQAHAATVKQPNPYGVLGTWGAF